MFSDFASGLSFSMAKHIRRAKFSNLLNLPPPKDNRLPPRTNKKRPKKANKDKYKKTAETSGTELPSQQKSVSGEKHNSPQESMVKEDSKRSISPEFAAVPVENSLIASFEPSPDPRVDAFVPLQLEGFLDRSEDFSHEYGSITPVKKLILPHMEIKVEKACFGEIIRSKVETPISKEPSLVPVEFTPFKDYDNEADPNSSEVENLFESIHRNLFPKFRAPMEARNLLESKSTVPLCYQNLLDAFINIELALFFLMAQNQRLTYTRVKDRIFHQTRR